MPGTVLYWAATDADHIARTAAAAFAARRKAHLRCDISPPDGREIFALIVPPHGSCQRAERAARRLIATVHRSRSLVSQARSGVPPPSPRVSCADRFRRFDDTLSNG